MASVTATPLFFAPWLQFAQIRLQLGKPRTVIHVPTFSVDDTCQGNYGFCNKVATHLVSLEGDNGEQFRVVHFERDAEVPFVCEMTPDGTEGVPVYLPVCEEHQAPFTEDPSPNQSPVPYPSGD